MRILFFYILIPCLILKYTITDSSAQNISPKAKAFITMTAYGAAGGALVGLATMAFGTSSRSIAQGASLGLYSGLLFGSYVLFTHHQKKNSYYDDSNSPYQESVDVYGDEYKRESIAPSTDTGPKRSNGFFDRSTPNLDHSKSQSNIFNRGQRTRNWTFYAPILEYQF